MKDNKNTFFNFDYLILVDGNEKLFIEKKKFIEKHHNKKFLGATFNHRMFNLTQKSSIKSEAEYLNLHHIMFSARPSFQLHISKKLKRSISFYKKFLQLYFSIFVCNKYNIDYLVLSEKLKKDLKLNDDISSFIKKNVKSILKLFKNNDERITFLKLLDYKKLKAKKINIKYLKESYSHSKSLVKRIDKKESNLFWLGFDNNFKNVPTGKKYEKDYWYKKRIKSKYGKPLFKDLKYCSRCCLPETSEGIEFDNYGICTICRTSEDKMNINWSKREKLLQNILNRYSSKTNYDCLLPISGGKDSTFQSYILKNVYKKNPLCVTHGTNWLSIIGRFNLENCLIKFDLDHLIFIPSRKIINQVAKKSVSKIGDACWHCHIGVGSISYQTSVIWKINLVVFGEAPADTDARGQHKVISEVSPFRVIKESAIKESKDFSDKNLPVSSLSHWTFPAKTELEDNKTKVVHLGQYLFWDEQKNIEFVSKEFGWRSGPVENTYKTYKSVECIMAGVHDYFNFIKRGIGRATVHSSEDVRRGLITREEGFEKAKKFDTQKPHALKYYKKITNLEENNILKALNKSKLISKYASKNK